MSPKPKLVLGLAARALQPQAPTPKPGVYTLTIKSPNPTQAFSMAADSILCALPWGLEMKLGFWSRFVAYRALGFRGLGLWGCKKSSGHPCRTCNT